MPISDREDRIAAVRRFNRFYTRHLGALNHGFLRSPFSLTEARVLYEIAHRDRPTATEIARDLGLDAGYVSRILKAFRARTLIDSEASEADGRRNLLALTAQGGRAFAALDKASRDDVDALLAGLPAPEQTRLLGAMATIEDLLDDRPAEAAPYLLRPHQPGDMGWVVHRQAVLYTQEYGWDGTFEALVAEIAAQFLRDFDPARERCWIAERDGEIVGSVFVVRRSDEVAKLRLLYVEPKARGLGIGRRLVAECIRFAKAAGYRKMTLWTNDVLTAARHLYEAAGFRLVEEERHRSFGKDLVGQTWDRDL